MKALARVKSLGRAAAVLLAVYLVSAAAVVALVEWSNRDLRAQYYELSQSSLLTTGTITSLEPHNSVCYRFVVSGTAYSACHGDWYDLASQQRIGGPIHVVYDPSRPSVSCSCDPAKEYYSRTVGPYGLGLVCGVLGVVLYVAARQWWRRTAPDQSSPGGR